MGNNVPTTVPIFRSEAGVTLLGGGPFDEKDLDLSLTNAPRLVAADGGAIASLALGLSPDAVYGDMDSLPPSAQGQIPSDLIHLIAEQNSTDFEKTLRHVDAPFTIAVGFTGARVDHELAVYHVLAARPDARCVVLGASDLVCHVPGRITLDLPPGTRVSLFPMQSVTGRSDGLKWPINGLEFHPSRKIGTSNIATTGPVNLAFDGPGMLVILPKIHLGRVVAAFAGGSI